MEDNTAFLNLANFPLPDEPSSGEEGGGGEEDSLIRYDDKPAGPMAPIPTFNGYNVPRVNGSAVFIHPPRNTTGP